VLRHPPRKDLLTIPSHHPTQGGGKNCPDTPERCPDWSGTLSEPSRDPEHPVRIAGYTTDGVANSVCAVGNYVFVADGRNGVVILEAQPLERPTLAFSQVATNARIQWAASALGSVLERNTDLNTSNWFPTVEPVRCNGNSFSVERHVFVQEYYRLRSR
jgi:hypothetical protein